MVPCTITTPSSALVTTIIPRHTSFSRIPQLPLRPSLFNSISTTSNASRHFNQQGSFRQAQAQAQAQPRTLFPGGYKRPELKLPTLILHLDADEVLTAAESSLELINKAVSKSVGIVVLASNEPSGGRLYEAACLLKSIVQNRAYLLIAERVDIATAAATSGVLLSDKGLPTVVARNTMLGSNAELVVLPLVARIVETVDAAINASKSEGADFLIYGGGDVGSVFENVKIPIFVSCVSSGKNMSNNEASSLLTSGASGFVTSLENFGLFDDDFLRKFFDTGYANDEGRADYLVGEIGDGKLLNVSNGFQSKTEVMAGFVKLEDREKQLVETERSVLNEALKVIKKAAPLVNF